MCSLDDLFHILSHGVLCSSSSEEIRSGTVVTYNDRQEILCQKCTDIALNEGEEDSEMGRSSESTNPSMERGQVRQLVSEIVGMNDIA